MKRTLIVLLIMGFAIQAQAKLGETEPQLIKRFGNAAESATQNTASGPAKLLIFRSANLSADVTVMDGVSVAEMYYSYHPLNAKREPPNDIVRAILRVNAPQAKWLETNASPLGADYALRSSDSKYVALLYYTGPVAEHGVWRMSVALASKQVLTISSEDLDESSRPASPAPTALAMTAQEETPRAAPQPSTPLPRHLDPTVRAKMVADFREQTKADETPASTTVQERTNEVTPTPTEVTAPSPAINNATATDESHFCFKGFCLGMRLDDAQKLINDKYRDAFGPIELTEAKKPSTNPMEEMIRRGAALQQQLENAPQQSAPTNTTPESVASYLISVKDTGLLQMSIPVVEADRQKTVTAFGFTNDIVDKLFNSADMPAKDFVQQFMHSYHIPEMRPALFPVALRSFAMYAQGEQVAGWEYTSSDGFRVRISVRKDVLVERVPSNKERKFD
jgi:hypothetical protein